MMRVTGRTATSIAGGAGNHFYPYPIPPVEYAVTTLKDPLISVIVPVYRVEAYLRDCVATLTNQTYQNLEILLIDDGSPDRCGVLCDELARADPRIRVIHQDNRGLSAARNTGLRAAQGELIGFVDSDDLTDPSMFARLCRVQAETGADVVKCGFVRFRDGADPQNERRASLRAECLESPVECLRALVYEQLNPAVWNKLYRRQVIGDLRFPERRIHEDHFFTPQICLRAKRVAIIEDRLYYYRLRDTSIMQKGYTPERLDAIDAWLIQLDLLKTHNVETGAVDALVRRMQAYIEWNYRMLREWPIHDSDGSKRSQLQQDYRRLPMPVHVSFKAKIAHMLRRINLGLLASTREEP
jgi:glycosyltransferase involved in cell wall biosynthesis